MRTRTLLLQSASVVAVATGSSSAVQAQDPVTLPLGYTVSFEGGYLMGNFDNIDKLGSLDKQPIKDLQGYNAAVSISRRLDPQWDLQVNANAAFFGRKSKTLTYSEGSLGGFVGSGDSGSSYKSSSMNFQTLDFEIGYRPFVGQTFDLRLFAGLRALHAVKTADKTGIVLGSGASGGYSITDGAVNTAFTGLGPRIGISASKRLEGSMIGFSGMVAAAAIYGPQETQSSVDKIGSSSGGPPTTTHSAGSNYGSTAVYNLEASLGIDLYISDATLMTVGYRAQQFWNIGPDSSGSSSSSSKDLIQGPFLKLTTSF